MLTPSPSRILPVVSPLLLLLGTACGPSDEEVQAMLDARVGALQERLEQEKVIKTGAELERQTAEDAAKGDWERSNDFIADLDDLMKSYAPKLPAVTDDTDVLSCLTDASYAQDPNLKTAAAVLQADVQRASRARRDAQDAFERRKWLQFRIDYGWAERVATTSFDPEQVCNSNYWGNSNCWWKPARHTDKAGNDEYDKRGQHLYSRGDTADKPELMKRLEAAALTVPDRFVCKVTAAEFTKDGAATIVGCDARQQVFIQTTGGPASLDLHAGDVVSVPLKDKLADPEGVLAKVNKGAAWRIMSAKGDLRIDTPAECPTDETIALKALEKEPSPQARLALFQLLNSSPPVTRPGKLMVAEEQLRGGDYYSAAALYKELKDIDGLTTTAMRIADSDPAAAITLLKEVMTMQNGSTSASGAGAPASPPPTNTDSRAAQVLQLLGGLEVQTGDKVLGQAHLREAIKVATDIAVVTESSAILQFIGDTEGVALANSKLATLQGAP